MADLKIVISADDNTGKALNKLGDRMQDIGKAAGHVGEGMSNLLTPFKAVAGIASGFVLGEGLLGLKDVVGDVFAGAQEAEQGLAKLNAVIESTGGAAGVSADDVTSFASAMQKSTTYTDDAVIGAENLLLTFTNIGKDVFPEATKTVLDMSTALGQDLKSSSVQLGKALNDPVKGITALSKVGVSFTEEQKTQIKTLTESGQTMQAQQVILGELSREFGGASEAVGKTFAGQLQIAKNNIQDVAEGIAMQLLPKITELMPAVQAAVSAFGDFATALAAGDFMGAAQLAGNFVQNLIKGLSDNIGQLAAWINAQGPAISSETSAAWIPAFVQWVAQAVGPLLVALGQLLLAVNGWIVRQIPVLLAAMLGWGQAFVDWLGPTMPLLMNELGKLAGELSDWIAAQVPPFLGELAAWGQAFIAWVPPMTLELLQGLMQLITQMMAWITAQAPPLLQKLITLWVPAFIQWVAPIIPPLLLELAKIIFEIGKWIFVEAVPALGQFAMEMGKALITGYQQALSNFVEVTIAPKLKEMEIAVRAAAGELMNAGLSTGRAIVDGIVNGIVNSAGRVRQAAIDLANQLPYEMKKVLGIASPSKVAEGIGSDYVAGFLRGLAPLGGVMAGLGGQTMTRSMSTLVTEARPLPFAPGANGLITGVGNAGGTVNITVMGSLVTEDQLAQGVRNTLIKLGRNTTGLGLS